MSAIQLSDKSVQEYNEAVARYSRRKQRRATIEATIVLLLTYGLLIYFMISTIIDAWFK